MSLTPVIYVDNETVIGAQNLNEIQDAILANEQGLANKVSTTDYNPAIKTSDMNQPVGKDSSGKLWTKLIGGAGLIIKGYYPTLQALQQAVPNPSLGDAYGVGSSAPYTIYVWSGTAWVDNGTLASVASVNNQVGVVQLDGTDINVDDDAQTPQTIKNKFVSTDNTIAEHSSQIVLLNTTVSGHTTDILNLQRRTKNNITSNLANLPTAIAQQNLEKYGYAIGDYFVGASGYTYWLADMDTYYGGYNSYAVVGTHHCAVAVDTKSSSQWDSASTAPRYDASALHTYLSGTVLNNVKSDLNALFGSWSSHIISHEMLANGIGTWGWSGANYIRAMTELEVYGSRVWSADNYQQGEAVKQLELFRKFRFNEIFGNTWFWLRSLSSSSDACYAGNTGGANGSGVTYSGRASGIILLY